jgi:hypothetical protein
MLEVARDRAAPLIERAVVAHAGECPKCGGDLERERAVTVGLRAVAVQHANRTPSRDLEAPLLEAFAVQHGKVAARARGIRQSGAARAKRWLPVAASVGLCAAGLAWWLTHPRSASAPEITTIQAQRPASPAEPQKVALAAPAADPPAVPRHRPRRPTVKPPIQAVGFIPLPSAEGLPAFESGQIVRLGIPVTALPNYGLDIPSGAESSIQADLLVGQDGQPRAIRLVNANNDDSQPRR